MAFYDGYGKYTAVGGSGDGSAFHLHGKKWLPIGDSITNSSGYPAILCSAYGLSELTGGHSGGRQVGYAKGSEYCAVENLDSIAEGNPDIITIALGTNDWGNNCPLGAISDDPTAQNEESFTFYGSYKKLLDTLYERYPGVPVILFTPFKRLGFEGANSAGYTLEQCAEAIRKIARYYSYLCCDLFSESGLSVGTIGAVTTDATWDGLHYNRSAMGTAVPKMAAAMALGIQRIYIPCTGMGQSAKAYTLTTTANQRIYVNPGADCTERVTWKSSNEAVVRVVAEQGYIYANLYAVADGTAVVSASCDGVTVTFDITVALA